MAARDRRFQILLDRLRHQLETALAPGETLPSERELASMHEVGATTVHRALQVLKAQGYVKAKSSVGWLRASGAATSSAILPATGSLRVGLMTRRSYDEWTESEMFPALLKEGRRRRIKVVPVPNSHIFRIVPERNLIELSRVPWNTFDVGLLVDAEDTIRMHDPILQKRTVLALDQDATHHGIDSVTFADAEGGAMVARHLLELGHVRFAVTEELSAPGYPHDPSWLARRHGFEAALGEAGGVLLPQWRVLVPRRGRSAWPANGIDANSHQEMVKTTVARWAALPPKERPTALFAISHSPLSPGNLIAELARHGLRVPRDLSIVAATWQRKFWGGTEPVIDGIRLTCVDFDLNALVRRAFDAAGQLWEEKQAADSPRRPPKLFRAPALLITGQSSASPPAL